MYVRFHCLCNALQYTAIIFNLLMFVSYIMYYYYEKKVQSNHKSIDLWSWLHLKFKDKELHNSY